MITLLQGGEKMNENRNVSGGWHLDKRVPIAFIVAIVFQTGCFIWFLAAVDGRVTQLEHWQAGNEPTKERLAILETKMTNIDETVGRIERKLDRDQIK